MECDFDDVQAFLEGKCWSMEEMGMNCARDNGFGGALHD
jgi:hypothetical protein